MPEIQKKFSFTTGLFAGLLITAAAAGTYLAVTTSGGDERPPIIVGDGSINVYADYDPHGGGRGEFEKNDDANRYNWHYRHASGAPTNRVDVIVLDGAPAQTNGDGCANPNIPFENLKSMIVTYAPSGTVTVSFDPTASKNERLQFAFSNGLLVDTYNQQTFWLQVPNIAEIPPVPPSTTPTPAVSYTLQRVSMTNTGGAMRECTFNSPAAQLKLYQMK